MKLGDRRRIQRVSAACALIFLTSATAATSVASCVTELNRIVKTAQGRVRGHQEETIAGAEVTVTSSSDDVIFETKSGQDGSFRLAAKPGKYRVEIEAEGYIRFVYIVDLRSSSIDNPLDVFLQSSSECHDIRIAGQDSKEDDCDSEALPPNLTIRTATIISGQVKDGTGAPLKNSEIVLRAVSAIPLQPAYLTEKTDAGGAFRFDESEPGEYRLLASPSRAFIQPAKLDCYEQRECNLKITLKASGTDLPYAGCPVR